MPSKGPSRASALMAMLAFHEVMTRATEHTSPACHTGPIKAALLGSPQALSEALLSGCRHRGEPTAGDSCRRTHLWLHLRTPGVGWWLKTEARVEAKQLGSRGIWYV